MIKLNKTQEKENKILRKIERKIVWISNNGGKTWEQDYFPEIIRLISKDHD